MLSREFRWSPQMADDCNDPRVRRPLKEHPQFGQCPIDAGSPFDNGLLRLLELEQPHMGKTGHEHDMRRLGSPARRLRGHCCESALNRDPSETSSQLVAIMLFFFIWLGALSVPLMTP